MSQKLRFPIVGAEPIKFRSKMPNFKPKSQYLGLKMPRRGNFASIKLICFIGGLLLKFACPITDYQLLNQKFRFLTDFRSEGAIICNKRSNFVELLHKSNRSA